MKRSYTVKGRWPFPTDMLRNDQAEPESEADRELVRRMSGDVSDDEFGTEVAVSIRLVMEAGEPTRSRPGGRFLPNAARWESFGWTVSGVPEIDVERRIAGHGGDQGARAKAAAAPRGADRGSEPARPGYWWIQLDDGDVWSSGPVLARVSTEDGGWRAEFLDGSAGMFEADRLSPRMIVRVSWPTSIGGLIPTWTERELRVHWLAEVQPPDSPAQGEPLPADLRA